MEGRTYKNARLATISSAADTDSAIFRSLREASVGPGDELGCVGGTLTAGLRLPSICWCTFALAARGTGRESGKESRHD